MHSAQEAGRAVEPVDQVGGEDQVIAGELGLEVAGVSLEEGDPLTHPVEPQVLEPGLSPGDQLTLVHQRIAQHPLPRHLHSQPDEAGGEVDARHLIEAARQFEGRTTGRTTQVQGTACGTVAQAAQRQFGHGPREVGYAVVLGTVVEFRILGKLPVRFIVRGGRQADGLPDHVAEPGMLEEVTTEGIARRAQRLVAAGDPGPALEQVVALVEGGGGEVVVERVDAEPGVGIDRGLGPLPAVPHHVEKVPVRETVHRAGGRPVVQVQIGRCRCIDRDLRDTGHVIEAIPLVLRGQPDRLAGLVCLPVAEGLGLVVIDLHRPVPGHGDLLQHQPQAPARVPPDPEGRMPGLAELAPAEPLGCPPAIRLIAAGLHEGQKLPV